MVALVGAEQYGWSWILKNLKGLKTEAKFLSHFQTIPNTPNLLCLLSSGKKDSAQRYFLYVLHPRRVVCSYRILFPQQKVP